MKARVLRFLVAFPLAASAGLLDKSVSWREEVTLRTGRTLVVERSATFGPDEFFRPGRGGLAKNTLALEWSRRTVKWEGTRGYRELPAILDIVDDAPVVVIPIEGWDSCYRHDFPRNGLVAWRLESGKWVRFDSTKLGDNLRMNLLNTFDDLLREPPGMRVVKGSEKEQLGARTLDKQGETIAALSKRYRELDRSCAKLKPAPDPLLDAARVRTKQAEQAAGTVVAERKDFSTDPQTVSAADVQKAMGRWMEAAWVAEDCRDVVKKVEPMYQHSGDASSSRSSLIGYTIHVTGPQGEARIALQGHNPGLASIACSDRMVVTVRRGSGDRMLVGRYDRSGTPIDATWVQLPGAAELAVDPKSWPAIWSLAASGDSGVTVVLADYSYTRMMNGGGTLRRKATYSVSLPPVRTTP